METPVKKVAVERAKKLITLVKQQRWGLLDASKLRVSTPAVEFSTIGSVIETYQNNKDELSAKAIKGNVSSIRIILRKALGKPNATPEDIGKLSTKVLTGSLIRDYKKAVLAEIEAGDEEEGETEDETAQRAKRTANSYLGQGRSLFTDRAKDHYRDAGLVLPDLKEFMEVPGFFRVGKQEYNAPPDEVIARTFEALEQLKESD
jgi:hypothetical protein